MIVDELGLSRSPTIEKISLPFEKFCLQKTENVPNLFMVRLDRIAPYASGNKIYKLYGILEYAKREGIRQIVSFGGAWSNHIHALALTAQKLGIESVGIIRGESTYASNPTLQDALKAGMTLEFVNRETYRLRASADYLSALQSRFPDALIVPEGGADDLALLGCAKIPKLINRRLGFNPSIIASACGTGTTAAGIQRGIAPGQKVYAYAVLNDPTIESRIRLLGKKSESYQHQVKLMSAGITPYAKLNKKLLAFILDWLEETGVLLDPVYTCKLCYRLVKQISDGELGHENSVAIIHSGGLQGWRGMQQRVLNLGGQEAWNTINHVLQKEFGHDIPVYSRASVKHSLKHL